MGSKSGSLLLEDRFSARLDPGVELSMGAWSQPERCGLAAFADARSVSQLGNDRNPLKKPYKRIGISYKSLKTGQEPQKP